MGAEREDSVNVTLDDLDAAFGPEWKTPGLFYAYEPALRFELGIGSHPLDRFLSALERAARIATHLIGDVNDLTLVVMSWPDPERSSVTGLLQLCRALRGCGLPIPDRQLLRLQPANDKSQAPGGLQMTAPIGAEQVRRVLWAAVGHDLGIQPRVPARLYLASTSRGVLLHPYDDRGMDVVGTSVDSIRSAYKEFESWLLSNDLERMKRTFER
jgi:hypothetical protein